MGRTLRAWITAGVIGFAAFLARPSNAEDKPTTRPAIAAAPTAESDDPRYANWVKFAVGSQVTLTGDITGAGNGGIEMTSTLKSVDKEHQSVTVAVSGRMSTQGQQINIPAKDEVITAKSDKTQSKVVGEQDVQAAGKTFKCTVYQVTTVKDGRPDGGPAASAFVSDQVPCGLVKIDSTAPGGVKISMTVTSFTSK